IISNGVLFERSKNAKRDADDEGKRERHQAQPRREWPALQQDILHAAPALLVGWPQVATHGAEEVIEKLAIKVRAADRQGVALALIPQRAGRARVEKFWLIQPEADIQRLERCGIQLPLIIIFVEWATGRLMHQKERHQRHKEQHWNRPEQTANNKSQHTRAPRALAGSSHLPAVRRLLFIS